MTSGVRELPAGPRGRRRYRREARDGTRDARAVAPSRFQRHERHGIRNSSGQTAVGQTEQRPTAWGRGREPRRFSRLAGALQTTRHREPTPQGQCPRLASSMNSDLSPVARHLTARFVRSGITRSPFRSGASRPARIGEYKNDGREGHPVEDEREGASVFGGSSPGTTRRAIRLLRPRQTPRGEAPPRRPRRHHGPGPGS